MKFMTSRPNFSWMNSRLKNVRAQLDYPPPPRTIRLKIPENTPKFMTLYFIYTEYKRFWTEISFTVLRTVNTIIVAFGCPSLILREIDNYPAKNFLYLICSCYAFPSFLVLFYVLLCLSSR